MKDFKIEYVDGQLVALDIDGKPQLDKTAVQAISFTHEQGAAPVLRITVAEQIVAPAQPEITQEAPQQVQVTLPPNAPHARPPRNKNRNRNRSH
ncbi:hypothetical protein AN237_26010 (plasmid) [Raoultella ornithinolytica]|uniref:hypothetical protein n=1 Tax=Raoultella ornithinolytica TaxID=54291 RepID=UPI00084A0D9D|nr:hypothetical protein [Raoultella ornithinolytica]AOO60012.1 hypothetical protein AN237_26010 [Raoultella ornithinolytica]